MSTQLSIATTDNKYTFTSTIPAAITWDYGNNTDTSRTQGGIIKLQKNEQWIDSSFEFNASQADFINIILPMAKYPTSVNITFDRNILGKGTPTGKYAIVNSGLVEEMDDGGVVYRFDIAEDLS